MEGVFKEAFSNAGLFSGDTIPADMQFLAALRNQAEDALKRTNYNSPLAAQKLIGMMDSRSFRDGPLGSWLESIAARISPKTAAKATPRLPQGQSSGADAIVPNAAAGATPLVPQGQVVFSPAAAPVFHGDVIDEELQVLRYTSNGRFAPKVKPVVVQRPSRVNFAYAGEIAKSVLDTFHITMRQGSVVAIGDVSVGSLERLTTAAGKRAWVGAREFNLLMLLKERAARQAHVPEGAKVRDIFDAGTVTRLIAEANATSEGIPMIVVPKVLEPADAAA